MVKSRDLTAEETEIVRKEMEKQAKEFIKQVNKLMLHYEGRIGSTTILYDGYRERRSDQPNTMYVLESMSGARFPKPTMKKNAERAVSTLKGFIKNKNWEKFTAGIKNVERIANLYAAEVSDYQRKVDSANSKAISSLEFVRDYGFIAVGTLCTTFVGGPVVAAAGLAGTYTGAALGAAVGGVLSAEIKAVAAATGRANAGQKATTNLAKLKYDALSNGAKSAVIAVIFAPLAKTLNDKTLNAGIKSCGNSDAALKNALKSRAGVGAFKTYVMKFITGSGKSQVQKNIGSILKGSSGDFNPDEIQMKAIEALSSDKKFMDGLIKAMKTVK